MRNSAHRVVLVAATVAFAAGCYEHAPRRGPLANLADSLVNAAGRGACLHKSEDRLLPDYPAHVSCRIGANAPDFYDVDRTGRVLSLVRNWADDSSGRVRAANVRQQLTARLGTATYDGDDTHGGWVQNWQSAALCVGLYRGPPDRELGFQLNYKLRDVSGGQCTRG